MPVLMCICSGETVSRSEELFVLTAWCESICGIYEAVVANYRWCRFGPVAIEMVCVADARLVFAHLQLRRRVNSASQLTTQPGSQCYVLLLCCLVALLLRCALLSCCFVALLFVALSSCLLLLCCVVCCCCVVFCCVVFCLTSPSSHYTKLFHIIQSSFSTRGYRHTIPKQKSARQKL